MPRNVPIQVARDHAASAAAEKGYELARGASESELASADLTAAAAAAASMSSHLAAATVGVPVGFSSLNSNLQAASADAAALAAALSAAASHETQKAARLLAASERGLVLARHLGNRRQ